MANESVRLRNGEVKVGQALAWPVFDSAGKLLLRQGYVIASLHQLEQLLSRGMFRKLSAEEKNAVDETPLPAAQINPFDIFRDSMHRLTQVFQGIESAAPQIEERILRLVRDLLGVCHDYPDAALGAVHLCHDASYTLSHPIHQACLVALVGQRLGLDSARREALAAAALTANVSMRNLQERLHLQPTPLTEEQREEVRLHPLRSAALLEQAGVRNSLWLDIVRQHHERTDGSGYVGALQGEQILQEARILALADYYCAVVSARADRGPLPPHEQLRALFMQRGQDFDETASLALIKELGIFPPGTFVRLASGEIGVVVQRGENIQPIVSALISPRGGAYARPLRRDCMATEYKIKENVQWKETRQLNLSLLWGYS
ncbi:MAG TPA: HD domain-containing phosphohydrolase [Gammaproteobacteria bacterium]